MSKKGVITTAASVDLFTLRKTLDEICAVPDKIISVYSLEQHVWEGSNSAEARKLRKPELRTIEEFQIGPVRPFLTDIFRHMAAPYKPERRDDPIGQGYWIQAEFGSGKSHLLCFLAVLALGNKQAWELVQDKEKRAERGKRESLYRFWEEGLQAKSSGGKKGIFVIVKTLVGQGGGAVGVEDTGRRLVEYVLDAAKEQLQVELGKNLSLYPAELLADRFISQDLERYRADLKKFLKDPRFFDEDEFEEVDTFIRDIQENKDPDYKRSCGNKLWRFYTEYLKVQPQIEAEAEEILQHMVETILAEGYSGVLLVLDEVSLFMKNRDDDQRADDEKTLVILSNRLAKVKNLPIWTVCAAQQAIESRMGVKNIIADDRLKLVKLLEKDTDYYDIILARVREIKDPEAIRPYYLYYKRGFTWPNAVGEQEFAHFFPFHKPALEVLRHITYELTTTRSAIHFMHQTLKHQIKSKGTELIRLWELFDEAVRYEEDPSGVHAGLVAIKTSREDDYRAYEACKRQVEAMTKGYLKVHRDKAIKTLQTLFLYHIARTRQQGLTAEEIANSVLIERDSDANPEENIQHYETLADNLKRELRQIVESFDEDKRPRYKFDPVFTGVDPRAEFRRARDQAETDEVAQNQAWEHLLALSEWQVKTRQMTIDLSSGVRSIFRDYMSAAPGLSPSFAASTDKTIEVNWQGRQVFGLVAMRDLKQLETSGLVPPIETDQTDQDFAVYIGTRPASDATVDKILALRKDPRIIVWRPDDLNAEERGRLLDFAAYRRLVADWQGKDTEDAKAVIGWVASSLQTEMAKIAKIVDSTYARGRIDALNNTQMNFHVAGELVSILTPIVGRVLAGVYESRDIKFDQFYFRREEAVKVINGIVKSGSIPKGAKPNQDISAVQNFGVGLKIVKKAAERELDISDNPYTKAIWDFVDDKLVDEGQTMKVETLYKNFTSIGGPKNFGLSKRLVQLYLLCLVQQGKIRVTVGPKSGLPVAVIDYSTIGSIDFSAKVLDALLEVQKMARPKNWDVLRPYAEKLLDQPIPATHDDAVISEHRGKLRKLFAEERETSARVQTQATRLFESLAADNPYSTEVEQVAKLFATDLSGTNDIEMILFGLKQAFGYRAFDEETASQQEIDDLANRLKSYKDIKQFLHYESDLLAGSAYCREAVPDLPELRDVRADQQALASKLANLQPYIDSEVKLKTELIGHWPPAPPEKATCASLVNRYTEAYLGAHDRVVEAADQARREIGDLIAGEQFRALQALEGISALQPPISGTLAASLRKLADSLFSCPSPSVGAVRKHLRNTPVHECGLTFENAGEQVEAAKRKMREARAAFDAAVDGRLEVFLNQTVRDRLAQGHREPAIARLLECSDVPALRAYLLKAAIDDPTLVSTINRYLKRIVIRTVKLSDFTPSLHTVEKGQIAALVEEFRQFIEAEMAQAEQGADVLPMLKVE